MAQGKPVFDSVYFVFHLSLVFIITLSLVSTPFLGLFSIHLEHPQYIHASDERPIANRITHASLCNCVVFRMDDIQDYWIEQGQIGLMDLFISKNQSLTLGLIMHTVGNDTKIINKIREGFQKGLFELALHGWDHVDYTNLSKQGQQYTLQKANEKMKNLFGINSKIFIPPEDVYNSDTLNIMNQLGIQIISSTHFMENILNRNSSVFIADGNPYSTSSLNTPIHIPGAITFKKYINGTWFRMPETELWGGISDSIQRYGYAVIILHPQDFVNLDQSGKFVNILNKSEIKELSSLMDLVSSKNMPITSFSGLVK